MSKNYVMLTKGLKLIIVIITIFAQITNTFGSDKPTVCGEVPAIGNPNILSGNSNSPNAYPWHVGIYGKEKNFLCGGSIISPKIILTAAHCVTDYKGNVQPLENYLVAAGKYYHDYDDKRDQLAQYSKVSEVHVPQRYKGIQSSLSSDIAILILTEPFALSTVVQPVCLESNKESENFMSFTDYNDTGIVTGWGYIKPEGPLSEGLKELIIPYVPFDKCFDAVPVTFRKFITSDKICGGYINQGINICQGDGGGGFVFKNIVNDRYYVKGVASASPVTKGQCDFNQYSTYTLVSSHIDFIRPLLAV